MNATRGELKARAKEAIKGNIGMFFVCTLIVAAITGVCAAIPVVGSIGSIFLGGPFALGMVYVVYTVLRGEKIDIGAQLFGGFQRFWDAVACYWLQSIFIALWSLLFVIPGIVKSFSYAMSFYILAENPEMSGKEAIDASKELMNGHKMELFMLCLSFIPWFLLTAVTCGIASIYVVPYVSTTIANFYLDIKGQTYVAPVETEGTFEV